MAPITIDYFLSFWSCSIIEVSVILLIRLLVSWSCCRQKDTLSKLNLKKGTACGGLGLVSMGHSLCRYALRVKRMAFFGYLACRRTWISSWLPSFLSGLATLISWRTCLPSLAGRKESIRFSRNNPPVTKPESEPITMKDELGRGSPLSGCSVSCLLQKAMRSKKRSFQGSRLTSLVSKTVDPILSEPSPLEWVLL